MYGAVRHSTACAQNCTVHAFFLSCADIANVWLGVAALFPDLGWLVCYAANLFPTPLHLKVRCLLCFACCAKLAGHAGESVVLQGLGLVPVLP